MTATVVNRLLLLASALLVPFLAVSTNSEQKRRQHGNRPPLIESFTSSSRIIRVCPFFPLFDKPEVTLLVKATDADGDSLHYEYSSTEGTISGEGTSVVWNLDGAPRGPHEIHVTVSDRKGGNATASLTVTTVDAGTCDPPPSPCPVLIVKVSCADEMDQSKPFIFSALVETDAEAPTPLSFNWKINAGRIVKGQNSREIEVKAVDILGFEKITATVEVFGGDPSCLGTVGSCSTKIIR
jgi:hypothetical protein